MLEEALLPAFHEPPDFQIGSYLKVGVLFNIVCPAGSRTAWQPIMIREPPTAADRSLPADNPPLRAACAGGGAPSLRT